MNVMKKTLFKFVANRIGDQYVGESNKTNVSFCLYSFLDKIKRNTISFLST